MAESKLSIVLEAKDKATPTLNKFNQGLGETAKKTDQVMAGFKDFTKVLGAGAAAIFTVSKGLDATIGSYVQYGQQVRELSTNLGISTEETSRLIQVSDDFKISIEEVRTSLQLAAKNGFEPSVENLAKLADRLKAMESPTERAAELSKIFGRNWAVLNPLLAEGGDALRANAASIEDNLILSAESVAKTREWELALDEWQDRVEAAKIGVGSFLVEGLLPWFHIAEAMPALIEDMGEKLEDSIPAESQIGRWLRMGQVGQSAGEDISEALEGISETAAETIEMLPEQIDEALKHLALLVRTDIQEDFFDTREEIAGLNQELEDLGQQRIDDKFKLEAKRLEDLEQAKDHLKELKDDLLLARLRMGDFTDATSQATRVAAEMEISQLTAEIKEQGTAIQELGSVSVEELIALDEEYNERTASIKEKIESITEAWDAQTKRMIFDLAQQRLAQGGFTEEELTALSKLAGPSGLGLIDESAQRLIEAIGASASEMDAAGDQSGLFVEDLMRLQEQLNNVEGAARGMNTELRLMPANTRVGGVRAFQHGGSFVVGGQGGPDSQMVSFRASPGERVTVSPQVTNNMSLTIQSMADSEDLVGQFAMMKALVSGAH